MVKAQNKIDIGSPEAQMQSDKQHGDEVEARLLAAGAMRAYRAGPSLALFTEPEPQFRPGDAVQVRVQDGSWHGGLRALSGVEQDKDSKVVWVCWEDEWHAARREGREPIGAPWPYEQVEFWEPGWMIEAEEPSKVVEQSNTHEQVSTLADMR